MTLTQLIFTKEAKSHNIVISTEKSAGIVISTEQREWRDLLKASALNRYLDYALRASLDMTDF